MRAGREAWIDTLRGAAVIGLVALNGRAILHSQDAATDPTAQGPLGIAGTLWWMASDIVLRETTIWLTAGLAGICIAMAAEQRPSQWRSELRARLVALAAIGVIIATTLWPADRLLAGTLAAALTANAARTASLTAAGVAAAIPLAIRAWRITEQHEKAAGDRSWDMLAATNPTREAWETSGYRGTLAEQVDRRSTRWGEALTGQLPEIWVWQIGAGLLAGMWWQRRRGAWTREQRRERGVSLIAGGLTINAVGVWTMATGDFHGTAIEAGRHAVYAGGAALAAGAIWLASASRPRGLEALLGPAGRAPLTAYASGMLALAAMSHGWGLGLHGQLSADATAGASALAALTAWAAAAKSARDDDGGPLETVRRKAEDGLSTNAGRASATAAQGASGYARPRQ